jgi:predicted hydrolase (HD superfamily)
MKKLFGIICVCLTFPYLTCNCVTYGTPVTWGVFGAEVEDTSVPPTVEFDSRTQQLIKELGFSGLSLSDIFFQCLIDFNSTVTFERVYASLGKTSPDNVAAKRHKLENLIHRMFNTDGAMEAIMQEFAEVRDTYVPPKEDTYVLPVKFDSRTQELIEEFGFSGLSLADLYFNAQKAFVNIVAYNMACADLGKTFPYSLMVKQIKLNDLINRMFNTDGVTEAIVRGLAIEFGINPSASLADMSIMITELEAKREIFIKGNVGGEEFDRDKKELKKLYYFGELVHTIKGLNKSAPVD